MNKNKLHPTKVQNMISLKYPAIIAVINIAIAHIKITLQNLSNYTIYSE